MEEIFLQCSNYKSEQPYLTRYYPYELQRYDFQTGHFKLEFMQEKQLETSKKFLVKVSLLRMIHARETTRNFPE
jgi:hypothetical protein